MFLGALLLCAPLAASAQTASVAGRIVHGGQSNRPVAGQWAVLQAIGRDSAGPVDSARTDGAGRYRLAPPRVDTASVYVVTTAYSAVEYFSQPIRLEGARRVDVEQLVVYDTTSGGPDIRLEGRFFTLFRPGARGGATMLEILALVNPGTRTRIAPDSLHPVWQGVLPPGAGGVQVGEGNLSPEAIQVVGDTVRVFAAIWPGTSRYTSLQYVLSGTTLRIPLDQRTGSVSLLVEDTNAVVSGVPLASLGVNEVQGSRFASYRGGPLDAGSEIRLALSRGPLRAEQLVPYVAVAAALALGWGLWVAMRSKPS